MTLVLGLRVSDVFLDCEYGSLLPFETYSLRVRAHVVHAAVGAARRKLRVQLRELRQDGRRDDGVLHAQDARGGLRESECL